MPLPTGPIPLVAYDEIIEESWGDEVAQSLNNLNQAHARVEWTPPSEVLAPTGSTLAHWFTIPPEITVPDWANHVTVTVQINGVHDTGAGNDSYLLSAHVGPIEGRAIRMTAPVVVGWFPMNWGDYLPCSTAEGDRTIKIWAARIGGSDRWAIDGSTDVFVGLYFHGAIGGS
jgi:hypothetical protein